MIGAVPRLPFSSIYQLPRICYLPQLSEEENRPIVELKNLVVESITEMERHEAKRPPLDNVEADIGLLISLTPLSTYMASKNADITYRQYMASPRRSLWAGKMVAKLIYGNTITWEQLREVYGTMPLGLVHLPPPVV